MEALVNLLDDLVLKCIAEIENLDAIDIIKSTMLESAVGEFHLHLEKVMMAATKEFEVFLREKVDIIDYVTKLKEKMKDKLE